MKLQKNGLDFINNDNAINPLDKYSLEELHILLQCVKTAFAQHKKNGVLISGLSDEDNKRYMAIYSEAAWYYFYRRNRQITYEYFAELVEIEIKLRETLVSSQKNNHESKANEGASVLNQTDYRRHKNANSESS